MTVRKLTAEVNGQTHVITADIPDSATPEQIKAFILEAVNAPSKGLDLGTAEGLRGPLTMKEKLVNMARSLITTVPEAAGMTLGGIGGAAVGAPAGPPGMFLGGVTGAGVGAGVGKGVEVSARKLFPGLFLNQKPPSNPMGDIATAANNGMIAEAMGQGIGNVLPSMFQRSISPQVEKELVILGKNQVPTTAGDIRPGGMAQIVENLTRGTLLGGRVMADSDIKQATRLMAFKKKMLDDIGPLLGNEDVGHLITGTVETRAAQLFDQGGLFSRAYDKVSKLYPYYVDTKKIRAEIIPLRDEVAKLVSEGRVPSASSPEAPSRFLKLLDDMANYGTKPAQNTQSIVMGGTPITRVDNPITYADVWKDKQTVDSIIRSMGDDVFRTRAKAVVKRIHNALDGAMEEAAGQVDTKAAQVIKRVNAAYARAKKLFETESLVADLRNKKIPTDRIVSRFFEGVSVMPEKDLLDAIPGEYKNRVIPVVKRRVIENMVDSVTNTARAETSGVTVTSGQRLENIFNDSYDRMKMIFNKDELEGIRDFISASKRAQMSGSMTNPASGRQMLAASQVGTALQWTAAGIGMVTGDDVGDKFMLSGMALLGPYGLAKMMINPSMARFIAKGFRISPTVAKATGWTARAANIFRMYEEQEKKNEPQP